MLLRNNRCLLNLGQFDSINQMILLTVIPLSAHTVYGETIFVTGEIFKVSLHRCTVVGNPGRGVLGMFDQNLLRGILG